MLKTIWLGFIVLLVSGCASYGVVENAPKKVSDAGEEYSFVSWKAGGGRTDELGLILAFSGGGTRAAAFSYGALKELRDTHVMIDGRSQRLLDQVDHISSVSGGSFTAAYYGLYGDKIFEDLEDAFLKRDVEGALLKGLFNPLRWFSKKGRTEMAVEYYEENLFHGATFADMMQPDRPQIVINASDLGYGVRFSFVQEYFNLLCSDLASYPVARAVTASSAVPVVFNPVVVENYSGCDITKPDWLVEAEKRMEEDPELELTITGLESYLDKDRRKYVHFVDGGITDNLGLRALYDIIEVAGGVKETFKALHRQPPRRLVLISVNAATDPEPEMDKSNKQPSLEETIASVSDVQLHRYNVATLELMKRSLALWAKQASTQERPVTPYFIQISFKDAQEPKWQLFFNQIPTSFSLTDEQVDKLIDAGHELLRNNPEYRRLMADLQADLQSGDEK